ncbi:MAG TPA: single-stranded DNA-binding protein [Bacilli bacterium]|jgi:single-strand DNA-binding protein|nr:single-stranded DNA-binding protein [Bacilli bacterium]
MINRVVLVGRLTKDPDLRRTPTGMSVNSFTIAVDNRVRAGAERSASFINCSAFGATADNMAKYTRKGSLVGLEGRLQQRTYENKEGRKVNVIEVIADSVQFLEPKGVTESRPDESFPADEPADDNKNLASIDIVDDDLPF